MCESLTSTKVINLIAISCTVYLSFQLGSSRGQQTTAKFNLTVFKNAAQQPPASSETPSSGVEGGVPRARAVGPQEEVTNLDRVTYLHGFGPTPRTQTQAELQLPLPSARTQALTPRQAQSRVAPFYTNTYAPRELASPQMQPRASTTFPYSQTYWNMGVYGQTQTGLGHSLGRGGGWGGLGLGGRRPSTWDTGREFWTDYSDRWQPDFYKRHLYAERSASYNPYVQPTAYNLSGPAGPYGGPPPPLSAAYVQYSQLNQVWDGRAENYPTPLTYQHAPVTTAAPKSSSRSRQQSKTKASSRPTSASRSRHESEFTAPSSAQVYGGEGGRLLGPAPIPFPIGVEPSAYGPLMSPVPGKHGHTSSKSRSRTRHTSDSAATAAAAAGKGARRFGPESQMYLGPNVTMTIDSVGHRNQQPHKTAASEQAEQAQLNIHNFTALDSKMFAPSASIPRAADQSLTPLQLQQQPNEAESQELAQHSPLAVTTPRLDYNVQQQPAAPAAAPMQPVQVQMPPGNNGLLLQPAMATPRGPQVNGQLALSQQLPTNIQVQAAQLQPPPQQQQQVQAPVNAKSANGKQKEKEKKPKEKAKEKKPKEKAKEKKSKEKPARVRGRPQELSLAPSTSNDDNFAD